MTTNVIQFPRVMRKDDLIDHLNAEHFKKPIENWQRYGWTVESLSDAHRIAHLSLGASADHRHGKR